MVLIFLSQIILEVCLWNLADLERGLVLLFFNLCLPPDPPRYFSLGGRVQKSIVYLFSQTPHTPDPPRSFRIFDKTKI